MKAKAKQDVDKCMSSVKTSMNILEHAMSSVESQENRSKIQQAINSLNSAHQQLSDYQD